MGMRIHLKVRGKLLIPILSVVFLGILALLTFVYLQSASLLEAQIQEGITLESQAASRAMQDWIEGRKDDVGNWARNSGYHRVLTGQPGGFEDAMRTLSGKIADFPYYESVNLLDLSGKVVASGDPERVGLDLSERDYFKQAAAGEVACSKPLLSKVSGNPVFVIAAPVKSPEGRVEGVLAGVFKIDRMTGIFTDSIKIGENGYAFVIDSEGLVIGHPNRDFIMKLDVADTEFGKVMLQQKSGVYKYWFEQQSQWKMMGFSEIPATGWIVAVTAPLTELLAPLVRVRDLALLGGLLTVVLAGLIIFFFVGRVTKVLGSAAEHLRELAEGNVERDVAGKSLQSGDELGDMARAFRSMVEAQRARAELAQAIASGDLRQRVEVASDKDRLGKALDEMVRGLNDIIGQIGVAAEQVREGSGQVSESSQALSQGATEQASSLEEITSSVTEISSQTRTNAENASQANQLASQARDAAREGDGEMREMVAAMEEINQSSQAINKIIKVIDEIAFQTNLLALNAAVEAARAGSHGKGFAVVAEEVRNLASRSAKAAQETAQLIEGSVVKVDKGGSMARQTAESLREIVEKITKVADIVADIAAASDEQAKGVGQINIGLSQIDQVTQQNTANAEETASASEELSSQAVEMRRLVGRFRLVEGPGRGPVAALDAAPPRREARQLPPAPQRRTPMRSASGQGSAGPERAGASASQDASRGAWGDVPARKAASGRAAGARPADPELVRPEEVISLDDDEFGRY